MEKTIKDGLRNIFGEMPQQQQEIVLSKLDELKIFSFILLVFGMSALCLYDFYQRIPFIRNDFYNKIYFIGNLLSLDKTTWAVMGVTIVFATLVYKVEGVCSKIMVKVRNQLSYSR